MVEEMVVMVENDVVLWVVVFKWISDMLIGIINEDCYYLLLVQCYGWQGMEEGRYIGDIVDELENKFLV